MIQITSQQRDNLAKLAEYLANLPADYSHFKMESYTGAFNAHGFYDEDEGPQLPADATAEAVHTCGTCACAVGHGLLAGIPAFEHEKWWDYEKRAFGVSTNDYGEHYSLWERMFGPEHPDDPHAAAQRISEVLRNEIEVVDA